MGNWQIFVILIIIILNVINVMRLNSHIGDLVQHNMYNSIKST